MAGGLEGVVAERRRDGITDGELEGGKARTELGSLQGLGTAGQKAEQIGFNETVLGDPSATFTRRSKTFTSGILLWRARRSFPTRPRKSTSLHMSMRDTATRFTVTAGSHSRARAEPSCWATMVETGSSSPTSTATSTNASSSSTPPIAQSTIRTRSATPCLGSFSPSLDSRCPSPTAS